ncbi:MAG TPA: NfeD family protein [Phycisphaerae bacterium]|jgi:membrane-bound serine protease (ClpP class)
MSALLLGAAATARAAPAGGRCVIIPIQSTIDDMTLASIKRRVESARQSGAGVLVFELDTPGGLVTSALDICTFIKNTTDLKTVAWVRPKAYSAGAMIAVACNEIVMSPVSSIGDCAPIMIGTNGLEPVPATERAKMESPIVNEFRDSAARNGYDALLSEAMVRLGDSIWWVEDAQSGTRRFVREDEKKRLVDDQQERAGGTPAPQIGATAAPQWRLVQSYIDPVTGKSMPARQPVVNEHDLLTMNQSEAVAYGFAKAVDGGASDIARRYGAPADVARLAYTWSEKLVGWLTSPIVRSILLMLVLLGAYTEFHAPGISVAGVVALVALALFLGAPYLTGLASVWEIVVLIIGIGLLALELFVIPGFGIVGITGIALILVALVATFVPAEPGRSPLHLPTLNVSIAALKVGVVATSSALIGSVIGMFVLSRFLPRVPVLRRVIPENPTPSAVLPEDPYRGLARVGDVGRCEGPLRPAGKARFGGALIDVVSEGEFLDSGLEVEVVERRGNRVVVRTLK